MSNRTSPTSFGLEYYWIVLKRQWYVVSAAALVGAIAAVGVLLVIPNQYTATAVANINVISSEPFNAQKPAGGLLDVATEALTAQSYVVAAEASTLLGGSPNAKDIGEAADVTSDSGTSVVRVRFKAKDKDTAVLGANAVTEAYLTYRGNQAEKRIDVMLKNINDRLTGLRESLSEANTRNANAKAGSAEANQAESQRHQISVEMEGLLSQKNTLESVDTSGGAVLTPGENNPVHEAPNKKRVLAAGILAGVVLGLLLAFVIDPRDRRIRSSSEFERVLGSPVLAILPGNEEGILARGKSADQLRVARELIFSKLRTRESGLLLLDDAGTGEISESVVNFAVVAAQAERRVQLILPEIGPDQLERLEETLKIEAEPVQPGLPTSFVSAAVPYLSLLVPNDTADQTQSDLLITREVRAALASVETGTYCILAMKLGAQRSSILASLRLMDDVVVIGRAGGSRSDDLAGFLDEARLLDVPVLGSIVLARVR